MDSKNANDQPPMESDEDQPAPTQDRDDKVALVEKAYFYLTEKRYPTDCTKNEKRSIRWKSEKLVVKDGVLYYRKKDGSEVRSVCAQFTTWLETYVSDIYSSGYVCID